MKSIKIIVTVCLAVAGYVCADATCECLTTTTINDCEYLNCSWGCPFLTCLVQWFNLPLSHSGPLSSQMHCSLQSPQAPFLLVGESSLSYSRSWLCERHFWHIMQQDGVSATIHQQLVCDFQWLHTDTHHDYERDCDCHKHTSIIWFPASHSHSHPQPSHIRCRWLFCSLSFSKRTNTMRYAKTTVWNFCLFIYFSCMLARMCSAIIDGYHFCGVHWHRNVRYPWPFLYSHSYTSCRTRSCLCPSWFAGISWHHPRDWAAH